MVAVEDVLREYGVPYTTTHRNVRTGWAGVECPWCGAGGRMGGYYLGINLADGHCNCWRCGHHHLWEVLAHYNTNLTKPAARKIAGAVAGRALPDTDTVHPGRYTPPAGVGPLLGAHQQYLMGRGYDVAELVRLWGLGGIGQSVHGMSWRVFIPVLRKGVPVTWTARSINPNSTRRYHAADDMASSVPPAKVLYGLDYCRHVVVVCEGPPDVWRIGPSAVCTLGTGYTLSHVAQLARYPVRVVCYDSEPPAQARARRLVDDLSAYPGRCCNVVLDAKDPGSAPPSEIAALRREFL